MSRQLIATLLALLVLTSCSSDGRRTPAHLPDGAAGHYKTGTPYQVSGRWYTPMQQAIHYDEQGIASWYGKDFHGKKTANGERYDMHAFSAAHKILPLPTLVRITNLDNGRSVIVRVNDRGPFVKGRLIDLSYAAAQALGFAERGTAHVRVQTLDDSTSSPGIVHNKAAPSPAGQYVQVGAFSSQANALALQQRLERDFPSIHVRPPAGASDLYRVRIGPLSYQHEIERLIGDLNRHGITHSIVLAP